MAAYRFALFRPHISRARSIHMKTMPAQNAFDNLMMGIRAKNYSMPNKSNPDLFSNGILFPSINPRFQISKNEKIFTIGSCFARNIESLLIRYGADVPVSSFDLPPGEIDYPAAHILNEYNAGTILQRIEATLGQFDYGTEKGIEETKQGYIDLFLHIHSKPVTLERLIERRGQISELYKQLLQSDTVIITLGLIECWYDTRYECYLNKAPSRTIARADPSRFEFRRMDVDDVYSRMHSAINLLNKKGRKKIILTVSPVPVEATFSGDDIVAANSYSKSVLRVACQKLKDVFDNVEYFPSFEMVMSGGSNSFHDDNTHVDGPVVEAVTAHMLKRFRSTDAKTPTVDADNSPNGLYQDGMSCIYQTRDLGRAQTIANQLLTEHPELNLGWDLIGHLHSVEGRHAEAADVTGKALAITPDHWGLQVRMARIMVDMEDLEQAERYFVAAVGCPGGQDAAPLLAEFRRRFGR